MEEARISSPLVVRLGGISPAKPGSAPCDRYRLFRGPGGAREMDMRDPGTESLVERAYLRIYLYRVRGFTSTLFRAPRSRKQVPRCVIPRYFISSHVRLS